MKRNAMLLFLLAASACAPSTDVAPADRNAVDAAAVAFMSYAHAFDYAAMRANATSDFEVLIFGRRLGMEEFIDLLQGMEESRGGRPLNDYELEGLNTEVVGDVAYTSWASPNWLESAVFVRSDEGWLMDRAASVRKEGDS